MSLEKKINDDIKAAMRAKDKAALRALRAVKSAILLAKTEAGSAGTLDDAAELKILAKMVKQRKDSIAVFEKQNRSDLAATEQEEVAVIEKYLPAPLNEADIKANIEKIIADTGASSMKDMGKVMGIASKQMAGQADGKVISSLVKNLLQ